MLQQVRKKISMGRDDKQSRLVSISSSRDLPYTESQEENDQQRVATMKAAEFEGQKDHEQNEQLASSSMNNTNAKSTDGPNRLEQGRVTRWIDLALRSGFSS